MSSRQPLSTSTSTSPPPQTLREQQLERERLSRQAALGRRVTEIQKGNLGPVIRRWVNGTITPTATLLRCVAKAYLAKQFDVAAGLLESPLFGLAEFGNGQSLRPMLEWTLRGESPGRGETTTYADDLVLTVIGIALSLCVHKDSRLTGVLSHAAMALRECVTGQFLTSIQGASAIARVRHKYPEVWKQDRSLARIVGMLRSQVKPLLEQRRLDQEDPEIPLDGRQVLSVLNYAGDERRLELRHAPDTVDWTMILLAWEEEWDRHRNLWISFALLILSCLQRTGGWFDLADLNGIGKTPSMGRRRHLRGKARVLLLSEEADKMIRADVDKWVSLGFTDQAMIVPPENGDYLSVKHRRITGRPAPKGLTTKAETEGEAWQAACTLAQSPWAINREALRDLKAREDWPADKAMILAEHSRLAGYPEFYLPVALDFRGRVYYRTTWVSPQQGDMGKALIRFPSAGDAGLSWLTKGAEVKQAAMLHCSALAGLDKRPLAEREDWFSDWTRDGCGEVEDADSPLTLSAAGHILKGGDWSQLPCQIDGTCNGLQHLSALFKDDQAAPHVNLTPKTLKDLPSDIYAEVAKVLADKLKGTLEPWADRIRASGLVIDRSVCKKPVMILPYGGTLIAIQEAVRDALTVAAVGKDHLWQAAEGEDISYLAFKERDIGSHPLFAKDCQYLGALLWHSITPVIPRAMAAMATFTKIGSTIKDRAIAWQVPSGLWVIQAKSKADRVNVKFRGFHLPSSVRSLAMLAQRNEIDPGYHRSGIVANFIHSLDASHLAKTILDFHSGPAALGGPPCIGAIHDCLLARPSQIGQLGRSVRKAFREQYATDPLSLGVKILSLEGEVEWEGDWYKLATEAGVSFPEPGSWDLAEVDEAAWFFS